MNPIVKYSLIAITIIAVGIWFFLSRETPAPVRTAVTSIPGATADIKIIAFGDSLTAGYGVDEAENYPSQLQDLLLQEGYSVQVLNLGVSGETTRGNLERADFVRKQNPDIVLLGIGGNDALRSLPITDAKNNIRQTVQKLQSGENPPKIILLQMIAPLSSGFQYKADFDDMYEEIADEFDLTLTPFLTTEIFFKAGNRLPDGIHYTKAGYTEVLESHILPDLRPLLNDLKEGA